nr:hypothetical protein [uncultured Acetatifactor sp.]
MKYIRIDETKLSSVMEIVEQAAELMSEKDCNNDEKAKLDLEKFQQELREITRNNKIQIRDFREYWGYTDLETVAKKALMPSVSKSDVSDKEIKEIIMNILEYEEAEMDWWLEYLTLNTGLPNLTNYIFYPDLVGLDSQATLEQIADKIIADRKQPPQGASQDTCDNFIFVDIQPTGNFQKVFHAEHLLCNRIGRKFARGNTDFAARAAHKRCDNMLCSKAKHLH